MNIITQAEQVSASDRAAASRLYSLEFTDIYFSENGDVFFRGLEADNDTDMDGDNSPLSAPPESILEELPELQGLVFERGQKQKEFFVDYGGIRFRVARIDAIAGQWFALRRSKWPIPRLATLSGIPKPVIQTLGRIGDDKSGRGGLILIAGRTGAGKTTTGYSLLQEFLTHYGDVAVTIEDPIEAEMSGFYGVNRRGVCFQTQVENGDFKGALKDTMRRTPRYIYLGEVRGGEEAAQAIRAAINGHIVITTIHAGSVIQALQALLKFVSGVEHMELAANILAEGITAVIHQQLVRQPGRRGKTLKLEYLFFDDNSGSSGARHAIRSNKMEQLNTKIEQQMLRVQQHLLPIKD